MRSMLRSDFRGCKTRRSLMSGPDVLDARTSEPRHNQKLRLSEQLIHCTSPWLKIKDEYIYIRLSQWRTKPESLKSKDHWLVSYNGLVLQHAWSSSNWPPLAHWGNTLGLITGWSKQWVFFISGHPNGGYRRVWLDGVKASVTIWNVRRFHLCMGERGVCTRCIIDS